MTDRDIKDITTEILKSVLSYQVGRKIITDIPPQKNLLDMHKRIHSILKKHMEDDIELDLSGVFETITAATHQQTIEELDEAQNILKPLV